MFQKISSKKRSMLFGLGGFSIFFILWLVVSSIGIIKPFFLPSPIDVGIKLFDLFINRNIIQDIFSSIYRIIVGFVLACAVGIPTGILIGSNKRSKEFLEPLIYFVRYIPPTAFVPLSILWFGVGDIQKYFVIFIGVAPYLAILTMDAVAKTEKSLIQTAVLLGATRKQIYSKVIIPSSLPGILDAMRLMFGATWTFIVLVEIVAASSGLGHVIIQSQRFLQTSTVIAVILLIGLLGLVTDYTFAKTHKQFFPWVEKR